MPVSFPPISRRRFLAGSAAAAGGMLLPWSALARTWKAPSDRFALLADTHIWEKTDETVRGVKMSDNFAAVADEVLAQDAAPAAVLIAGDCAYLEGEAADYKQLVRMIEPYRKAGLPVHFALGNHDHRQRFWEAFPKSTCADERPVESKHLLVVEAPKANWFLLDSLQKTNFTPGRLGDAQLKWLAGQLDARPDKPAIVLAHHNLVPGGAGSGLQDTDPLWEVIVKRPQVKAYLHGHTHHWNLTRRDGVHVVGLPPTAYLFNDTDPNGWVEAVVEERQMTLCLYSLDKSHPVHETCHRLAWR